MDKIEKLLAKEKIKYDEIKTPDCIDDRLRKVLYNKTNKGKKKSLVLIATIVILFSFVSYNYDAIAYYGKKILGYDMVMNDTLNNLNNLGKGQEINKSYQFANGITVTLDGIMVDDNSLIAFYTIKKEDGNVDKINMFPIRIKGFREYINRSGQGEMNEEKTEIKWVAEFDTPSFFEKNLRFCTAIPEGHTLEEGEIKFTLNRKKAMGYMIKEDINESVEVGKNIVHLDNITATATSTVIKGSINNLIQYLKEINKEDRTFHIGIELALFADGKEIKKMGSGISSGNKGITFEQRFDALPNNTQVLDIKIKNMSIRKKVNKVINLNTDLKNQKEKIEGQSIIIKEVTCDKDSTNITVSTKEHVGIYKLKVLHDNGEAVFDKITKKQYDKIPGEGILYERTFKFAGTGENMKLQIGEIIYTEDFDEHIIMNTKNSG